MKNILNLKGMDAVSLQKAKIVRQQIQNLTNGRTPLSDSKLYEKKLSYLYKTYF